MTYYFFFPQFFLNIGGGELILILFVTMLLFGADKFPIFAKKVTQGMRELKRATDDVKGVVNEEIEKVTTDIKEDVKAVKEGVEEDLNKIEKNTRL